MTTHNAHPVHSGAWFCLLSGHRGVFGRYAAGCLILIAAISPCFAGLTQSMVEIHAARVEMDRMMPWRRSAPSWQSGYGVAVAPGLFLTAEALVRNSVAIQMRKAGSIQRVPAQVVLADNRAGLALVAARDADWFSTAIPLEPLDHIPAAGVFHMVQWGANDHLQMGIGTLMSIGFDSIGRGVPPQLTYELAASLRVAQVGAPVVHDGRLAGLAMRFKNEINAAVILSPDSITRFLAAARRPDYIGVPEPDFETVGLADPVRRRFLGVESAEQGVLVLSVRRDGMEEDEGLRMHDVLLVWDGVALDARGNYPHPDYGRLPFQHRVAQRTPGDRVMATVVRNREIQPVVVPVRTFSETDAVVPENAAAAPDDYVVEAGLVFRELTHDFLRSFGEGWPRRADIRLVWQAMLPPDAMSDSSERIVILVGVLADPVNIGYQSLQHVIVKGVNGRPVFNLADLAARVDAEGLSSIALDGMEVSPLAFNPGEVPAANVRIRHQFRIPNLRRLSG